jgi:hypothetical protein
MFKKTLIAMSLAAVTGSAMADVAVLVVLSRLSQKLTALLLLLISGLVEQITILYLIGGP